MLGYTSTLMPSNLPIPIAATTTNHSPSVSVNSVVVSRISEDHCQGLSLISDMFAQQIISNN